MWRMLKEIDAVLQVIWENVEVGEGNPSKSPFKKGGLETIPP